MNPSITDMVIRRKRIIPRFMGPALMRDGVGHVVAMLLAWGASAAGGKLNGERSLWQRPGATYPATFCPATRRGTLSPQNGTQMAPFPLHPTRPHYTYSTYPCSRSSMRSPMRCATYPRFIFSVLWT